ncbi:MAG: diadenylate cyclase CdaA [Clostridia bacterium]|nr:diadenylate cyclase CdaA [Clostridia bacterium]
MSFAEVLQGLWERYIMDPISQFSFPADFLDILMLTALFYGAYSFVKGRRAAKLAIGAVIVVLTYVLCDLLHMEVFHQIISAVLSVGIIIVVIIFQPELRDLLERIGSTPFGFRVMGEKEQSEVTNTINAVVDAAIAIAQEDSDGALIVIERTTKLGEYIGKGHPLDASVTVPLLRNIFINRSPLHDGAVIISNNRIAAAGCKLPLTTNEEDLQGLGTRHRAAVGITEYCNDCVVVVVSEERHRISVANCGVIKLDYNKNVSDLRAEESVKVIRNNLRQDLFHMLTDVSLEEINRMEKRKASKERKQAMRQSKRMKGRGDGKVTLKARRPVTREKDVVGDTASSENTQKD